MKSALRRCCFRALLSLLVGSALTAHGVEMVVPACAGVLLDTALRDLQDQGMRIIFSSDVVRPGMCAAAQPESASPRDALEALLAPHQLAARDGPAGTVLIVKRSRAAAHPAVGEIRGWVRHQGDGRPAAGVMVRVVGGDLAGRTGEDGRFVFSRVPVGTYSLRAEPPGFSAQSADGVVVSEASVSDVTFELAPMMTYLNEVVVTPSHFRMLGNAPESRQFLSREEVDRMPHLADDLYRAVSRLPGTAGGDLSAEFHVRGGETNELLVILDGMELYEPFHFKDFGTLFSVIDSEAVGGVEVLTGGFPAEYGDRMSGVMEVSSSPPPAATRTTVGASIFNFGVLSEGRFSEGGGHWLASVRRGYLDVVLSFVDADSDLDPSYYDALAKVELVLDDRNTLSTNVLASADKLDYAEHDDSGDFLLEEVAAEDSAGYLWLNLKTSWSPVLHSQTVLHVGSLARHRDGGIYYWTKNASVSDDRSFDFYGLKQDWSLELSDRHFLKWGVDARRTSGSYDYSSVSVIRDPLVVRWEAKGTIERDIEVQPAGNDFGAYFADRVRLSDALIVELGLRWDKQTYTGESLLSPRANLVYRIGPNSALRAAWGRFGQSQRIDELQVEDGVTDFYPAQIAEHRLIGFEHAITSTVGLRADVYEKQLSNLRPRYENLRNVLELFPEVEPDRVRVAPDRARSRGVEVVFRRTSPTGVNGWLSYAWAKVDDEIDGAMVPRSWDQEHSVSVGASYGWHDRWNLSVVGVYHSGWPHTGVTAELATTPDGTVVIQPSWEQRNGERFSAYHRLDLRLSRDDRFSTSTLTTFLEILNIFNHDNVAAFDDFGYSVQPGGRVWVLPDEEGWLPFIPSIGFRYSF